MKIQTILVAGLIVLLGASAQAQSFEEPAVKILPTSEKGVLKLLYAYESDQTVEVKVFNTESVLLVDEITGAFPTGFTKKYDFHRLTCEAFWVEVTSSSLSVLYKVTPSRDRKTFVPVIEKTTFNYPLVASNK